MKKIIKTSLVLIICVLMTFSAIFMVFAEGEYAYVNGNEITVGDTFTYSFEVSGCEQEIIGMQINFFYDRNALQLVDVNDGVLGGTSTINDDINGDGRICIVNPFMNGGGLDCTFSTELANLTFMVKSPESSEITYFIQYLYDIDMVDIHTYEFNEVISTSDGFSIKSPPILADNDQVADIILYDNFPNTDNGYSGVINSYPSEYHDTEYYDPTEDTFDFPETDETEEPVVTFSAAEEAEPESDTDNKDGEDSEDSDLFKIILGIAGIVLIVAVLIIIWTVIIRKIRKSK